MIPLAKWLQDDNPPEPDFMSGFASMPAEDPAAAERHQAEIEDAYQRGRTDGALERDAAHAEDQAAQETAAAAREAAIIAEWSAKFSDQLAAGIEDALANLRRAIESALENVLGTFLEEEVRRKLSSSLLQVVENETSGTGRLPLEISAPEDLHDHIRTACESRGLTLSLTPSPEIKIIFRDGLLRFDDMSKHWSEMIRNVES